MLECGYSVRESPRGLCWSGRSATTVFVKRSCEGFCSSCHPANALTAIAVCCRPSPSLVNASSVRKLLAIRTGRASAFCRALECTHPSRDLCEQYMARWAACHITCLFMATGPGAGPHNQWVRLRLMPPQSLHVWLAHRPVAHLGCGGQGYWQI